MLLKLSNAVRFTSYKFTVLLNDTVWLRGLSTARLLQNPINAEILRTKQLSAVVYFRTLTQTAGNENHLINLIKSEWQHFRTGWITNKKLISAALRLLFYRVNSTADATQVDCYLFDYDGSSSFLHLRLILTLLFFSTSLPIARFSASTGELPRVDVVFDYWTRMFLARSRLDYTQSKRVCWKWYAPVGTSTTTATLNRRRPTHETKLSTSAEETDPIQYCNTVILLHKVHSGNSNIIRFLWWNAYGVTAQVLKIYREYSGTV
jgi:hypothetical protein